MVSAIIVDDEAAAISALSKKLELYCEDVEIVSLCQSAKEGLLAIKNLNPDIVFLDIEMPWMNGFELLQSLGDDIDFQVVFVTAYDQYAVKAFKVRAQDYLLKPVDKDDLIKCVNTILDQKNILTSQKLSSLLKELNRPQSSNNLVIHSKDTIDVVKKEDIAFLKAESNYSHISLINGSKLLVSKTLNDLDEQIDSEKFIRVHRSYTVNVEHIRRLDTSEGLVIILNNNEKIPVSRRKRDEVLDALT